MAAMDDTNFQAVLADLRAQLDAIDERLVLLLKERAEVIRQVIQRKQASGLGPVDLAREEEMLDRIAARAKSVGLDPDIAIRVLRAIIDAFTALEAATLGSPSGKGSGHA